jgi:hypothetical protein
MSEQYTDIHLDIRDRFSVVVRDKRLYEGPVPSMKESINIMESPTRLFGVSSMAELDQLVGDYKEHLERGSLAILFDIDNIPSKVLSWASVEDGWKEIGAISVNGPVLVPATESDKGIVQLAAHNETIEGKAVQANDPRLIPEIVIQSSTPLDKKAVWIDTATINPMIKMHNGIEWITVRGKKIIDDVNISEDTTFSSNMISKELNKKATSNHTHNTYDSHISNKSNPHIVKASQLSDFNIEVSKNGDVAANTTARHEHLNEAILNGFSESTNGDALYKGKSLSKGDMTKAEFDKDGDGIIDHAKGISNGTVSFNIVDFQSMHDKTHNHANAVVLNATEAVFTKELKAKVDSMQEGANKYIHPDTHYATQIVQDYNHRFATDFKMAVWEDKYTKLDVDDKLTKKEDKYNKGKANGYASLDSSGQIPISQIPLALKETRVVRNIAERNILNKYSGLRAFVVDASSDPNVPKAPTTLNAGYYGAGETEVPVSADYIWSGSEWLLTTSAITEPGGEPGTITWASILDGPMSSPLSIDDAVNKVHEHSNKSILDSINYTPVNKNGDSILGRINFSEGNLKGLGLGTSAQITLNSISGDGAKELRIEMLNSDQNSVINIVSPSEKVQINGHEILHAGNLSNVINSSAISDMRVGTESERIAGSYSDGTLYMTLDSKKIYLYIGGKIISFLDNSGTLLYNIYKQKEFFSASAGTTIFTLAKGHYKPGTNTVSVFMSGSRLSSDSFIEISDNSVALKDMVLSDVQILIEYVDSDTSDTLADGSYPVVFQQEVSILGPTDTVIQIYDGKYKPNTNTISLYIDGIRQPEVCFVERSNTEIELKAPIGDTVQVMVEYVDSTRTLTDETGSYKFILF